MTTFCPHCFRTFRTHIDAHAARCPHDPALHAAYAAAMADPDRPGWALGCAEYDQRRPPELYSGDALRRLFNSNWPGVAAYFGMEVTPRSQRQREAMLRRRDLEATVAAIGEEVDAARAAAEAAMRDEGGIGLPVLRYRTRQVGGIYQRVYEIR